MALPLFLLLCLVFTIGLGLLFSALYVRYRDIRQIIPFIPLIPFRPYDAAATRSRSSTSTTRGSIRRAGGEALAWAR